MTDTYWDASYFPGIGGATTVTVAPGATVAVAHDDPTVVASPATAWTTGQSATFSDGEFYWDGTAWQAGAAPAPEVRVAPGSTRSDIAHTDEGVRAWPGTAEAWTHQGATFSDGDWHWDGTAWVAVVPVAPGATVTQASTDGATVPRPATVWDTDESATFSDGAFTWDGAGFVAWTEPEPAP